MNQTTVNDPLVIALFSEIAATEQLARTRLSRALPPGMELSHFIVLNHFARLRGEKTPAQLARIFHLTKGAMTNTLSKLERAGYVHIRPDWDDARRKLVSISPAGLAAREAAVSAISPVFEDMMRKLGPEKIRAALPFLRELREHLGDGLD
ncbi:MarR family winged helix-turn-helix transcriptional regulator [Oceanomicrobium pacificus]|uniref:MarR family transcriptional regulator n=1 Tax=Oceanomicrobium pacificus TaxID=2692916 RepID=A0A6B0TSV8_9RHOB|nr:MarR family transcriptional regulator [Oceanomicrobium pacificus]MXU64758.1 MarR family transcriptional regulator [Oceanomicrobium pacificus]